MSLDPVVTPRLLASLSEVVLIDCRPDADAYLAGHLPDAYHAQLERDLSGAAPEPARGGRHPLPDVQAFAATLGRWGVSPSSQVVAYDEQNGANAAARLWWMLRAIGHRRVQVVDGGLPALLAAGFTLTGQQPAFQEAPPYPIQSFALPQAEIDEVEHARLAPDRRVIDARAAFRYCGDSEPIDPIAGHISGAVNVPLTANLNADGSFKSAADLRRMYESALGPLAPAQAIIHCGSGVTACHTLLALDRAGLSGAKLYVGSWSEWCRNDRPRATSPT